MSKAAWLSVTILAMSLVLAACSQRYHGVTSGSSSEYSSSLSSDREACINSCNSSYAVCMDSGAARRERDDVPSIFGAGANCDSELRKCLPACKGR